ncbi:MAG: 30S ribosomal protein S17 [Phycisphaerales bacterium]|nr:MAG: 30S ribosomal protein S17 [Phycisphaerales bacterium]
MAQQKRPLRRTLTGVVETDKRDKSIKVVVNYVTKHKVYGKYVRRRTVVHAHDPQNEASVGDTVEVMECRPVSKTKSWRLVKVVRRGS